jgi:phage terminase Nu1 subunit (DNA packaging protein)
VVRQLHLSQTDFAKFMGLTTRTLRNLEQKGMPHEARANQKFYPLPDAVQWYVNAKIEEEREKHRGDERDRLELERLAHQNREAKVRADLAAGSAVLVEEVAAAWADGCGALVAEIRRMPTRFGDVVRPDDPAAGEDALERVAEEVVRSLQEAFADWQQPQGNHEAA